jgi:hypothetical protein
VRTPKFAPVPFKEEDLWNGHPEETNEFCEEAFAYADLDWKKHVATTVGCRRPHVTRVGAHLPTERAWSTPATKAAPYRTL